MVTQQVILTTTVIAAGVLTQQRFVGGDGALCAEGKAALGVAEVDGVLNDAVPVNVLGIVAIEAGGAIARGAVVQADDQGRAITKAAGASNGMALDAATAEGELIRILRGV